MTRVSGVVINTSGGSKDIFFLTFCVVSPCLISMVRLSFVAYDVIRLKTSRFKALRGVM